MRVNILLKFHQLSVMNDTVQPELFAWKKIFTMHFCHLLSWMKILPHNFLPCFNDYMEPMATFNCMDINFIPLNISTNAKV